MCIGARRCAIGDEHLRALELAEAFPDKQAVKVWMVLIWIASGQQHLEQCCLWQLGTLEELHSFPTTDNTISVLVGHAKPVVK